MSTQSRPSPYPSPTATSLQQKYEAHLEKPRPRKNFARPEQYGNGKLKRKPAPRTKAAARTDPHIKRSRALWQIRDAMPVWLWTACNQELDACAAADPAGPGKAKKNALFDTDKKRETALARALALPLSKSNVYATRPVAPLPSSPAVDILRCVLSEAPRLPRAVGEDAPGLQMERRAATASSAAVCTYEWDAAYLDRLWSAIVGVVRAHGTGADGWGDAKWEVYDTVRAGLDRERALRLTCRGSLLNA